MPTFDEEAHRRFRHDRMSPHRGAAGNGKTCFVDTIAVNVDACNGDLVTFVLKLCDESALWCFFFFLSK